MSLTKKEYDRIDKILARALDHDMSAWDQSFVNDMVEKLNKFGLDAQITPRQLEQIDRIDDQYV